MHSFLPKFTTKVSYLSIPLWKKEWLPVRDRKEYYVVNTVFNYWNGIVPGYIYKTFQPLFGRCNADSLGR